MTETVAAVMRHCNNYFEREKVEGDFVIDGDGVLSPDLDTPYIAIKGSRYHDGVHAAGNVPSGPQERFHGEVYGLCPPPAFLALCGEIQRFDEKNPAGSPVYESFGNYSYSRGGTGRSGTATTWRETFAGSLRPYMRMFTEVGV